MAYPGEPSGPPPRGGTSFLAGRLTPDDFEQLAAAFRPSWEFDDAPFTGPGSLSSAELQLLQTAGGTLADVRAAAPLTNGVHGHAVPKAAAISADPEDSVIVDAPPPAATPAPTPYGPPVSVAAAPAPSLKPTSPDRLAQTRIVQRPAIAIPPSKDSTGSFDAVRPSKKPLWIGLGAVAVAAAVFGIYTATKGPEGPEAPVAASTAPTAAAPTAESPTQPATQAAATPPAPAPSASPAPTTTSTIRTIPISALAQVPATVQTSAPVTHFPVAPAPPPAPAPRPVAPVAPRPAPRPKAAGGTIVHDVPF
jgi:flagellar protein FliO/FliZ